MSYITARSGFEGKSCDSGVRADCQNSLIPFSLTRVCPYQLLRGISLQPSDQGSSTHQIQWPLNAQTHELATTFDTYDLLSFSNSSFLLVSIISVSLDSPMFLFLLFPLP